MKVLAEMQTQGKALSDPTRFRLFAHIAESEKPVLVSELTELLGFNHNAIRQHLGILVLAGLIHESNEIRATRGRPRKQYVLRADALNAFAAVSGSYDRLSQMLLEFSTSDASPYEVGYRFGADQPLDPAIDQADLLATMQGLLGTDGFSPRVFDSGEIVLDNCPFAKLAAKEPGVICELHRGIIAGHLSNQPVPYEANLSLQDPATGGCRVQLVNKSGGES